jgi:hypothetical protein
MEMGSQDQGLYARGSPGATDTGELKEKASQLGHTARQRAMSALDGQRDQPPTTRGAAPPTCAAARPRSCSRTSGRASARAPGLCSARASWPGSRSHGS